MANDCAAGTRELVHRFQTPCFLRVNPTTFTEFFGALQNELMLLTKENQLNAETLSRRWFLCAVNYFVIGVGLGVFMGASGNHSLFPAHAHINLLGWASMALTGLLYRSFPAAAQTALAAWHFWLYQLALPVMLLAVVAIYSGYPNAEPVAGAASVVVFISVLLFWWAIFSSRDGKTV